MSEPGNAATIVVRTAEPADAGEIHTVQRAAFVDEAQRYSRPDLPPLTESVEQVRAAIDTDDVTVLVAELIRDSGPRLVGSARLTVRHGLGHVARIAVAPDHQGTGVGTRLLTALHEQGESRDDVVSGFELTAGGESASTVRWYAGHGYQLVGMDTDPVGVRVAVLRRPTLSLGPGRPRPHVACYVTAKGSGRVLVVDDPGGLTSAPPRVPADAVHDGESVARAAVRTVAEASGLSARFVGLLGFADRPHPDAGPPRRVAYVHLEVDAALEAWFHLTDADARKLACRWIEAGAAASLADGPHRFLETLGALRRD